MYLFLAGPADGIERFFRENSALLFNEFVTGMLWSVGRPEIDAGDNMIILIECRNTT